MSSFHTAFHTTYWAYGLDQAVDAAGNEEAGVTVDGAGDASVTSQGLDWIFADALDDLPSNAGVGLGNLEATSAGAYKPQFNNSHSIPEAYGHMNKDFQSAWLAPTPPLTDSETIASPPGDSPWDGNGYVLPPTQLEQGYKSSAAATQHSPAELAWLFEPGQFDGPAPPYAYDEGGIMEISFDFPSTVGATSWGSTEISAHHLGMAAISTGQVMWPSTYMPASSGKILRKRPRCGDETNSVHTAHGVPDFGPRKRVKGRTSVNGVLGTAGSTSMAPHNSSTKIPIEYINGKSEAAGRGAGRLAAPNAHEVYHQFLQGPSVQKELAGTSAQGQLPWVEGRAEEAAPHYASNAEVGKKGRFRIPEELSERQQSLLRATSEDLACGTVQELKCRLCPDAGLHKWEDFRRHCNHSEAHPLEIWFCQYCGDFFARSDSLDRHQQHRPRECLNVSPDEAEAKRKETKEVHDGFQENLERCLGDSEEVWTPFSQTIKAMYPKSSKRGSRQQCRTKSKA